MPNEAPKPKTFSPKACPWRLQKMNREDDHGLTKSLMGRSKKEGEKTRTKESAKKEKNEEARSPRKKEQFVGVN